MSIIIPLFYLAFYRMLKQRKNINLYFLKIYTKAIDLSGLSDLVTITLQH